MQEQEFFKSSDGWVFASLYRGRIKLSTIIQTGDILNHAIFSLEEINDGLSRLESENFIEIEDFKLKFTKKAKAFIKAHHKIFEGHSTSQMLRYCDGFEKIKLEEATVYKQYFSQEEYDKAIEKYVR